MFTTNFFKSYDRAFVRRILWNIEVPAPGIEELEKIWELHLGKNVPKDLSYTDLAKLTIELAQAKSIKITGGDVRKLTLMFCTQLTSGRYTTISKETATMVINKYLDDLQEVNPTKFKDEEISQANMSDKIKNELYK